MTEEINGTEQEAGTGIDPVTEKRNRFLGLALGAFVVILAVVSYFRISALSP